MPSFGNWLKNTGQRANRFMNKTVGHMRTGVAFLNNTILPGAQKAHKTITAASGALQQDSNLSAKSKEKLSNLSRLSDMGLQRLSSAVDTVNRVHAAV
jgi:hypothetical protein